MVLAWIYLLLAIITEVIGTMMMNASGRTGNIWSYLLMFVFISVSYTLLSFALRSIAVGIAIAIWEGLGTALISAISILFLHEPVNPQKMAGLGLALAGISLLHFGEKEEGKSK